MTRADFSGLWDQLLTEGTNTVTIDDIESRTGATRNAVYLGVKYAIDRKRLFSPVRGLYVVVPAEYRSMGFVPATQFIDPMMNHLGIEYYLGLATAAGWRGSSHHAPQEFQVIVNGRLVEEAALDPWTALDTGGTETTNRWRVLPRPPGLWGRGRSRTSACAG